MARPRTGSLEEREDSFYARITVDSDVAGTVKRKWFCLNTKDPETAERLRDQLNANASPAPSISPHAAQTVKERAVPWHAARKARGVKQWDSERGWLENHIYPKIGRLPIGTVRPAHIMEVINSVLEKKLSPGTVEHIRSTMHLLFDEAWRLVIIFDNPVRKVKVPPIAYVEKPRVILTDDEVIEFWSCEDAELEIRMLGLVARCEGGMMRTRDCTAWDWTMIDRERFASCIVPRTKTGKPQRLDIPDVLQAPLRAWWATQEHPTSGPVFPVTRRPRKGEARLPRGVSFADRLRRNLMIAGVKRHPCQQPDVRPTEKTACCPDFASDPVYKETGWSLPVDFHSFRRAFSTGLAEAGVNAQQAMLLAGQADTRAHSLYVMETEKLGTHPGGGPASARPGGFCHSHEGAQQKPE